MGRPTHLSPSYKRCVVCNTPLMYDRGFGSSNTLRLRCINGSCHVVRPQWELRRGRLVWIYDNAPQA